MPLRAVQGDATDLAALIGGQGADLVLCHSVLEYVDSPAAAMTAVASVLRPGGAVSVLAASAVAAVIHRALAGRFDEARRLLAAVRPAGRRSRHGVRARARPAAPVHPGRGDRADRGGRAAPRRRRTASGCSPTWCPARSRTWTRAPRTPCWRWSRPPRRTRPSTTSPPSSTCSGTGEPRSRGRRRTTAAATSCTWTWTRSTPAWRSVTGPSWPGGR